MIKFPKVSVLLPVYNYYNIFPTIESILHQSYKNFELLVCDDGSKPALVQPKESDSRLKYFTNNKNIGLGRTLNRLLSVSTSATKYFATIEQDDIYKPYFLEKCVSFLEENSDYGLVSGISEFWDGNKVSYRFPGMLANGKQYPYGKDMFLLNYREQIKVAQTCMVVNKKVHNENGLEFSNKYPSLSVDWDYILRFSLVSKIGGLYQTLVTQDRTESRSSLTTKIQLKNKVSRQLLSDFYNEFPEIIKPNHYRYALATQLYIEMGTERFFNRIFFMFQYIFPLDPNSKRKKNRLRQELNKLFRFIYNNLIKN